MRERIPDLQTLTLGLMSVFSVDGVARGQVVVLDRRPNIIHARTFPSEIVTCRFDDGSELHLFCKYEAGRNHNCHGHRGGVAYEAAVYRDVLQPLQTSTPRFYGSHIDEITGETWLILEYLDKSVRLTRLPQPRVGLAARWIGEFHAAHQAHLSRTMLSSLNTYDAEYYRGWVHRTSLFAGHLHQHFPWLVALCKRFEEILDILLAVPPTIIHGEFYGQNVLFRDGIVYPVDWESAAIGVGEIDLASLTEGWPARIMQECDAEYQRARWPNGAPADFERTLAAARLYLHFRWLGDRPEWTMRESNLWRFEQLRSAGERLELI